ncbi:MAG: hypothetical protein ACTJGH_02340 [Peptoniphilaceae bacterium]
MTNVSLRVTEKFKGKLIKKAKEKDLSLSAYIINILQDENISNQSTLDSNN